MLSLTLAQQATIRSCTVLDYTKRLRYLKIILEYFYMDYFPFIGIAREEEEGQKKDEGEKG
jgi:hypothetical protein